MKDLLVVMKFTMKDMIKRKSFIISTIIFLIMIVVGFNIPNILKSINGEETSDKLVIVDEENIFEGSLESLKNVDTGYEIEISNSKYEEIKEKINNEINNLNSDTINIELPIINKKADGISFRTLLPSERTFEKLCRRYRIE